MNVNLKNTPLDNVLAFVLWGKELDWKYSDDVLSDDVLVIHKKDTVTSEKIW